MSSVKLRADHNRSQLAQPAFVSWYVLAHAKHVLITIIIDCATGLEFTVWSSWFDLNDNEYLIDRIDAESDVLYELYNKTFLVAHHEN